MLPALRFFRHQDGSLALFNGVGPTMPERIISVLRHDETAGSPLTHAPYSGYERLSMGSTTIIADTGLPPPVTASRDAHAGCLAFEMSSGRQRYIVNSGIDRFGPPEFRPLGRSTAAHSTATINDTSSCRFSLNAGLSNMIGTPIIAGPTRVQRDRIEEMGRQGFVASHDGYARLFGIYHERRVVLSHNGSVIQGADRFYRGDGRSLKANGRDNIAVRFHVHPSVDISFDENGLIILSADRDDTWVFSCFEVAPQRGFHLLRGLPWPGDVEADRALLPGLRTAGSELAIQPRRARQLRIKFKSVFYGRILGAPVLGRAVHFPERIRFSNEETNSLWLSAPSIFPLPIFIGCAAPFPFPTKPA